MGRRKGNTDGSGKDRSNSANLTKGQEGGPKEPCRALEIVAKGLRTSSDSADMIGATIFDTLTGTISVGQSNVVLNGVGKLIQIKKLEMQFGAARNAIKAMPFSLPGGHAEPEKITG